MSYLLDTNVLSEPSKARPNQGVLSRLADLPGPLLTASVVWHEVLVGVGLLAPSKRRDLLRHYVDSVLKPSLVVLPYDEAAATYHARERARLVRKGRTPSFADGQIAAIARTNGLVLVTRNVADFREFDGLEVESWFS